MNIVFIGGCVDRQVHKFPDRPPPHDWFVPKRPCLPVVPLRQAADNVTSFEPIDNEHYTLVVFRGDRNLFYCYVADGITPDLVLSLLFKTYMKGGQ